VVPAQRCGQISQTAASKPRLARWLAMCDAEGIQVPADKMSQIGVSNLHPFGDSGGSRGVDHVSQAFRLDGSVSKQGSGGNGRCVPAGINAKRVHLESIEKCGSGHQNGCA